MYIFKRLTCSLGRELLEGDVLLRALALPPRHQPHLPRDLICRADLSLVDTIWISKGVQNLKFFDQLCTRFPLNGRILHELTDKFRCLRGTCLVVRLPLRRDTSRICRAT